MLENLVRRAARILVERGFTGSDLIGYIASMQRAIESDHSTLPCPFCFLEGRSGYMAAVSSKTSRVVVYECCKCYSRIDFFAS